MQNHILIKGARQHNLRNINIKIPRDKIIVITGPSGSGKSSLAIDTIYAESQRRYIESMSIYARQFLEQMQRPDIDHIEGLSPSIALIQNTSIKSLRSTVGTITDIYDYLRVLYTNIGIQYCYKCGLKVTSQNLDNILKSIMSLPEGTKIQILSPIIRDKKGEYKKELSQMRTNGFVRARINGKMTDLTQDIILKKTVRHTIEIVIDRLIIKSTIEKQIKTAMDISLKYSNSIIINIVDDNKDMFFSKTSACQKCGISYPDIEPRLFSFNSNYGQCKKCQGLGFTCKDNSKISEEFFNDNLTKNNFNRIEELQQCSDCKGMRLRREALNIKIRDINIWNFCDMLIGNAIEFVNNLILTDKEREISKRILKEILDRLIFLEKVGLGYLTLDRSSLTLSGGEAQRIRLATQLGTSLSGIIYILDEPSIGLHPKDCLKLIDTLYNLRDKENTVIIVEHDEGTILKSDYIIDMGPGAGKNGGWVVAEGNIQDIKDNTSSITGQYLKGQLTIPIPKKRRVPSEFIKIYGASEFNLKSISVSIPLRVFSCVTGVSGSGKSTLIFEVLYKSIKENLYKKSNCPIKCKKIEGLEKIDKAIVIDQSPLGKTSRSNTATFTGIFSLVREIFAGILDSKIRGYDNSRFSFNTKGGRCEDCEGNGIKKIEMHFLQDVYVTCNVCKGSRYNKETMEIYYKNKNISDVLNLTASEAIGFFNAIPKIKQKLNILEDIGMGYLKLGQSINTFSGGEAQRLRLSRELSKKSTGNTLYILDEPTTGLHFVDIQNLINIINRLVNSGNTVIVIEHNLDVIKSADYIIDVGPNGGDKGGNLIFSGIPEEIIKNPKSYTGQFLSKKIPI